MPPRKHYRLVMGDLWLGAKAVAGDRSRVFLWFMATLQMFSFASPR